jgi:hypothetical protein
MANSKKTSASPRSRKGTNAGTGDSQESVAATQQEQIGVHNPKEPLVMKANVTVGPHNPQEPL